MSKSADHIAAREQVYSQLSKRFPPKSIEWVRTAVWDPAAKYDLDRFDTEDREDWAASSNTTKVKQEADKWEAGTANPAVAIQIGNSSILVIVDGHHRYLARELLNKNRMMAFVGHVPDDKGPWMETHLSQIGGPSG